MAVKVSFLLFCSLIQVTVTIAEDRKHDATVTWLDNKQNLSTHTCFGYINLQISFGGHDTLLQLQHNSMLQFSTVPLYLIEDTHINEDKSQLNSETVCYYQDFTYNSALEIQLKNGALYLDGHFSQSNSTFHIKTTSSSLAKTPKYTIEESVQVNFPMDKSKNFLRKKRAGKVHCVVEVLVVTDYSIYERWYIASNKSTEKDKKQDAIYNIKYYFAHVINDMDLRYRSIISSKFDIRVTLSGFVIATTPGASKWTQDHRISAPGSDWDRANISPCLVNFTAWIHKKSSQLPGFDHAMLFTGLDLYSIDKETKQKEYLKTGQAAVGQVCQKDKTAIVEDRGRFYSTSTATHELGHNLGARHDGVDNGCSGLYIMNPSLGGAGNNISNIYRFSQCSINEISNVLLTDANSNCVQTMSSSYNQTAWDIYMQELPGQKYDIDQQCVNVYGDASYYCGAQQYSGRVCKVLVCHNPADDQCMLLNSLGASRGTTCGNKKWCIEAQCVYDEKAPAADESCIFGDYRGLLVENTLTCEQMISNEPWLCYSERNRQLCCSSCQKYFQQSAVDRGCQYGDRQSWCKGLTAMQCYKNDHFCCDTCYKHKMQFPGCEYGDKATGCTSLHCSLGVELDSCCLTCASSTPKLVISSTTSTSTTSHGPPGSTSTTVPTYSDSTTHSQVPDDTNTGEPVNNADHMKYLNIFLLAVCHSAFVLTMQNTDN